MKIDSDDQIDDSAFLGNPTKPNRHEKYYWLAGGAIFATVLFLIIYFSALNDSCSTSSPAPPPYNPSEYLSVDDFYQNVTEHGFTIYDNMRLDRLSGQVLSPDGMTIVFTRKQYQMPDSLQSTTTLHIFQLNQGETWMTVSTNHKPSQVTMPMWGIYDSSPQWTSDGKAIVFLSNRPADGSQQVFYIPYDSKNPPTGYVTPVQVTMFPIDVDNFFINPTGNIMAFSVQIYPGTTMAETVQMKQNITASGINALEFTKLFVRHWDTWRDGTRNQPHLILCSDKGGKFMVSGDPMNILTLSNGTTIDSDVPTKPYGGIEEWSWSPDGTQFAFTRRYDETSMVAYSTNLDIFLVDITDVTPMLQFDNPRCITADNPATDTQPRFSPDGNTIAYLAMAVPEYESDRQRIRIYDQDVDNYTGLTENWTNSVGAASWSLDGTYLWAEVLIDGDNHIYTVQLNGTLHSVINVGDAAGVSQTSDGYILFQYSTWQAPINIYASLLSGFPLQAITTFNHEVFQASLTSQGNKFSYPGSNGDTINGWMFEPVNKQVNKQYPMVFLIHGGPRGAWEQGWSYRWNPQVYTGAGYAVVAINPHGSTGYGQPYTDAIQGDYGGGPFVDLMKGWDYATTTWSDFINKSQVAALGASYGGYMINWIAGQKADNWRFKALVCHDGMFDIRSFYYSTEELWFPEHDMPGVPWLNATNFEQWNPATPDLVKTWHIPMLVIHGGTDYRITEAQGIGAFTALQRQGVPSKFLYFPKENHWVLNARNQIKWHETVLDWIGTYVDE